MVGDCNASLVSALDSVAKDHRDHHVALYVMHCTSRLVICMQSCSARLALELLQSCQAQSLSRQLKISTRGLAEHGYIHSPQFAVFSIQDSTSVTDMVLLERHSSARID